MPATPQPDAQCTQSPFFEGLRLGLPAGRPLQCVNEGQGHCDKLALSVPRKSIPNPPKPQPHGQGGKLVPLPRCLGRSDAARVCEPLLQELYVDGTG